MERYDPSSLFVLCSGCALLVEGRATGIHGMRLSLEMQEHLIDAETENADDTTLYDHMLRMMSRSIVMSV